MWFLINSNRNKSYDFDTLSKATFSNFEVFWKFSSKFSDDKVFINNPNCVILLDGFILNRSKLKINRNENSWNDVVLDSYLKDGINFLKKLKGHYSGFVYDKCKKSLFVYTNHTADKTVFYFISRNLEIYSSCFNCIINILHSEEQTIKPSLQGAYSLLTYGYMIDNFTHSENVYRLRAGEYLTVNNKILKTDYYYKLDNENILNISFKDAVDQFDYIFRNAVKTIFEKDIESGYSSHLADMSGGLDCRMVNWVARDLGYNNITNICFSQSESYEWIAAKDVSYKLKNKFFLHFTDNADFIFDVDELTKFNYGLAMYSSITGGKNMLKIINTSNFGFEITGLLGDVIAGAYNERKCKQEKTQYGKYRLSSFLKNPEVFSNDILNRYPNQEIFTLNNRGFFGILNSILIRNEFTEVVSPFLDKDLINFCLSLPFEYRFRHKLFNAWIIEKYPEAGKISTTRYGSKIFLKNMYPVYFLNMAKNGIIYRLGLPLNITKMLFGRKNISMNPHNSWERSNIDLMKFLYNYFNENINRLRFDKNLFKDASDMFSNGILTDKLHVITLLSMYKRLQVS